MICSFYRFPGAVHVIRYIPHVIIINNDNNFRLESDNASHTTGNCFSLLNFPHKKMPFSSLRVWVDSNRKIPQSHTHAQQIGIVLLHHISYTFLHTHSQWFHTSTNEGALFFSYSMKPNTPLIFCGDCACGYAVYFCHWYRHTQRTQKL